MSVDRFNKLAQQWDSKPQRVEGALTFVDEIIKNIPNDISNFNLLDYGCGSGLVSFGFSNKVHSITGMDNSVGMLEVYNQKASNLQFKNIKSILHNIDDQDLDINSFDLIVTNMTMHHIQSTESFIKKISNSLTKGGYLAIADLEIEDGTFHSCNEGVVHFGFDSDKIKEIFEKNGLKIIVDKTLQTISKPHKDFDVFILIGEKI